MPRSARHRARLTCAALAAGAAVLAGAPAASAHEGEAKCTAELTKLVASWAGSCVLPFQGFPVGVAGFYQADDPERGTSYDAEISVEMSALLADGTKKPVLVSCNSTQDRQVSRCFAEKNPLTDPLSLPEPFPEDIVALQCDAESRAFSPSAATPSAAIACWSTDEAREDLYAEHWFSQHGFGPYQPPPPSSGGVDPLRTLSNAGVQSQVVAVPVNTYAPTDLYVDRKLGLNYTNFDLNRHDVVARDDFRPDGSAAWCADFPSGRCPQFWTPLIDGGGTQAKVLGLEDAEVNKTYTYYCSIHPYMVGTITVVH